MLLYCSGQDSSNGEGTEDESIYLRSNLWSINLDTNSWEHTEMSTKAGQGKTYSKEEGDLRMD